MAEVTKYIEGSTLPDIWENFVKYGLPAPTKEDAGKVVIMGNVKDSNGLYAYKLVSFNEFLGLSSYDMDLINNGEDEFISEIGTKK